MTVMLRLLRPELLKAVFMVVKQCQAYHKVLVFLFWIWPSKQWLSCSGFLHLNCWKQSSWLLSNVKPITKYLCLCFWIWPSKQWLSCSGFLHLNCWKQSSWLLSNVKPITKYLCLCFWIWPTKQWLSCSGFLHLNCWKQSSWLLSNVKPITKYLCLCFWISPTKQWLSCSGLLTTLPDYVLPSTSWQSKYYHSVRLLNPKDNALSVMLSYTWNSRCKFLQFSIC